MESMYCYCYHCTSVIRILLSYPFLCIPMGRMYVFRSNRTLSACIPFLITFERLVILLLSGSAKFHLVYLCDTVYIRI